MRNHEVTKPQDLLMPDGRLREPGWSRQLVQNLLIFKEVWHGTPDDKRCIQESGRKD